MEYTEEKLTMLQQLPGPAFFVENGVITAVNEPARQHLLFPGTLVAPMLQTGTEEYSSYQSGHLYLDLNIGGAIYSAAVTAVGSSHLFKLEQEADRAELQSMALAAQILRTPLSNVMSTVQSLFPLTAQEEDPQDRERIAHLNRGLYQMLRVICNMSDAYHCYTEKLPRTELREIGALVREQFEKAAPLMEHTGITLHYTGMSEVVHTLVDAQMLERAIGNILSNAVKFTPRGGTVNAVFRRKGGLLYLTVQDSGIGIPAQLAGTVFSRYQRSPGLEDSRFGLGLGMMMIRSAAAASGGTVLLEQGNDFGLRLTMTLAIQQPTDPTVRSPMIHVDYAGEWDHLLLELSDCLPPELYTFD